MWTMQLADRRTYILPEGSDSNGRQWPGTAKYQRKKSGSSQRGQISAQMPTLDSILKGFQKKVQARSNNSAQ